MAARRNLNMLSFIVADVWREVLVDQARFCDS